MTPEQLDHLQHVEEACDQLLDELTAQGYGALFMQPAELTHPEIYRRHGEYALWLESVWWAVRELNQPSSVRAQMERVARLMQRDPAELDAWANR